MALTKMITPEMEAADAEDVARAEHLARQVAAVRRRSRRMKTLRNALPVAIILLLALNFGWITVQNLIGSMTIYRGAPNEDRMVNPRFQGLADNGDHYTISGLEAVRIGRDSTTVTLKSPIIDYKGDADRPTHISANSGVYDQNGETFTMTGNVVMIAGGSDMTFKTQQAIVDLANSTFHGNKHIEGDGSLGHIVGESFIITDQGRNVSMKGSGERKVFVTIPQ